MRKKKQIDNLKYLLTEEDLLDESRRFITSFIVIWLIIIVITFSVIALMLSYTGIDKRFDVFNIFDVEQEMDE